MGKRSFSFPAKVCLLGFCLLWGGFLLSQAGAEPVANEEQPSLEDLLFKGDEFLAAITKRSEKTYEAAANVTVISGKFLERYAIRNINDLFEVLEGAWHTHKGQDEVLALRGVVGYANDKILFLYDGMIFPTFLGLGENNWPAGDMGEVERIEIIKGPSSSIWGGQGTQGAINIVHKGAQQFQGLKTSVTVGKYGMARFNVNYAKKPNDDLSYQILANSVYYKGFYRNSKEWWGEYVTNWDKHDLANPLPDYEIFANAKYKDFTIAYRRLESRTGRQDKDHANSKYVENFADDVNIVLRKPEYWKNTDWTTTLRFNNFYQMYDVFQGKASEAGFAASYEMKTEKRYELDTNVLMTPIEPLSVVLGAQGSVWSPQGSGPTVYWGPDNYTRAGLPGSANIVLPPEYLPTFTEMGNDIAAVETYVDAKYNVRSNLSVTGGGRYVSEFNPGNQFRDIREKLHRFFPKAAVVYSPLENMYLKGIYEQAFTRLNTFERYSEWNNVNLRGSQKATTSETTELVVDWRPLNRMKVLASYYNSALYDFANFIYTGTAWPVIAPGEVRGFFNMGDHFVKGVEAKVSYDWDNFGGFISGSQLLQNNVRNLLDSKYASGSGVIAVDKSMTEIGWAWNNAPDEGKFNRASVPRYNIAIGGYYDFTEDYSVSGVWKHVGKIAVRHEEFWADYYHPSVFTGGSMMDLAATAKNVGVKNLNFTVIGKNVTNKLFRQGSAMDPGHAFDIDPVTYEVRASYLW